jgi:hypothetical protein
MGSRGGDGGTTPATCRSLVGSNMLHVGLDRRGRAESRGDGKHGRRQGTPATGDGLRWLGSNREGAGGAQGREEPNPSVMRVGGAGRGHAAKILASVCPSSYLFGADKLPAD